MYSILSFTETSPSAPGTTASSQLVSGSAGPAGIASGQLDDYVAISIEAVLQGATGGTLDVYIQNSPDMGLSWYDYAHFAQMASAAPVIRYVASIAVGAQNLTLITVGTNLSPALAAGTVLGGPWGDRFRLVMVAGAGTSVGAPIGIRMCAQRSINWK